MGKVAKGGIGKVKKKGGDFNSLVAGASTEEYFHGGITFCYGI